MIVSVIYFIFYFGIFLILLVLWAVNRKKPPALRADEPLVSILIAVRNEEHTITRCLEAISKLNYPSNKIEVLLGDDASTDNTLKVVQEYIRDKPLYKIISIREKLGQARGKGNVLAHLTKLASSEYFFITDADIAVPVNWIQNMLAGLPDKVGIVTGITTIAGNNIFHKLQAID